MYSSIITQNSPNNSCTHSTKELSDMMQHSNSQQQRKTKWRPEEDQKLLSAVNKIGIDSWIKVAQLVPGRNSKQCRERWMGQLAPSIVKTSWTKEEDDLLISQHSVIGNKWTLIAAMLPGRSAINVKNRWSRLKRNQPTASNTHYQSSIGSSVSSFPHISMIANNYSSFLSSDSSEKVSPSSSSTSLSSSAMNTMPKMNDIIVLQNQPNIIFEFPMINNRLFGEEFTRFQEQMLH